jgi:hypothetical protein
MWHDRRITEAFAAFRGQVARLQKRYGRFRGLADTSKMNLSMVKRQISARAAG